MERIYLIDTTSPFFVPYKKKKVNWSKIPFHYLENQGVIPDKTAGKIKKYFKLYIDRVKEMGYNSISVDELCYMAILDFYNPELVSKLEKYRGLFQSLFDIASSAGMKIFINTDIMFYNQDIEELLLSGKSSETEIFEKAVENVLNSFPEIEGIIFRIGESDGLDAGGDFKSRLFLKTKKQANTLIKRLLPIFEKKSKYLIFRTWTVGAYELGDLMWNEKTYNDVFRDINSENLIISMKFGDTDFFRYLRLNQLFFLDDRKKIIELQTRREYEGFGEFPSFVGWDYKAYRDELMNNRSIVGMTAWCQTGGWATFKNFTFLKNSLFWNELNTYVSIQIFKNNKSVEQTVVEFAPATVDGDKLVEFLRISDEVIKELLYDPYYSAQELYFNRVRIPPIIHIFWNNVTLTSFTLQFYRAFCRNHMASIKIGFRALEKIKDLRRLAIEGNIPQYNYEFHFDTFFLLAKARELIYRDTGKEGIKEFKKLAKTYKSKHPKTYRFYVKLNNNENSRLFLPMLKLLVRKNSHYRLIDRMLFNPLTSRFYLFLYRKSKKRFPKFLNKQAMPIDTLFR